MTTKKGQVKLKAFYQGFPEQAKTGCTEDLLTTINK
jgi:hypothetical protein